MSASMQPMYGGAPAGPPPSEFGARRYVHVYKDLGAGGGQTFDRNGTITFGGSTIEAERADFLTWLDSYTLETFQSSNSSSGNNVSHSGVYVNESSPLSVFGGLGSMKQFPEYFSGQAKGQVWRHTGDAGNGRWSTSPAGTGTASGVPGAWWETARRFWIEFPLKYTAFGFDTTDVLDFLAGYLEILVWNGTRLVDSIQIAGDYYDPKVPGGPAPKPIGETFFGVAYGDVEFDKIEFVVVQTGQNYDYQGFDGLVVGLVKSAAVASAIPLPTAVPALYAYDQYPPEYDYFGDTILWTYPPAAQVGFEDAIESDCKYKKIVWDSLTTNQAMLTFEPQSVGALPASITFPAPRASLVATITASGATIVTGDSQTTQFTPGGAKNVKTQGDVEFQLSAPVTAFSFFFTLKSISHVTGNPTRYKVVCYKASGSPDEFVIPTLSGSLVNPGTASSTTYTEIGHVKGSEFWAIAGVVEYVGFKLERTTFVSTCWLGLDDVSVGTYVP